MFQYFGYGSNLSTVSLRAKGVRPLTSTRATLTGWRMRFNVEHFFRHEGGVANIEPSKREHDHVLGVLHECPDEDLAALDAVEACGVGYQRIEVRVSTPAGDVDALAYVGMPAFVDNCCLPCQRYINILVAGATRAGLAQDYISCLKEHPIHAKKRYTEFELPAEPADRFDATSLARQPRLTSLAGAVFDMSQAREKHQSLQGLFGGKDMTLFHLKRLDTSDGTETLEDIRANRLSDYQREFLNEYLNEYNEEYTFAGRFDYY